MAGNAGTIVVTGGAGALGAALARTLVARGERVVAVDLPRARDALDALARELGERCVGEVLAPDHPQGWTELLGRVAPRTGAVTGAALVAGGWAGGTPVRAEANEETLRAMLQRNVESAHAALRALLPGMVARRAGSVVVVGSRAVERPWTSAGAAAYGASKAAVVALAQAAAQEVLEHGVRINAVLPSTLDTPANRAAMPDADPARWVALDSLARVMAFLLSDDARDVSGAAIPVYGRA
jgi:NAD(P)-dependent dehydrogenase (short-subunit alcohol dehydrogenase family)